MKLSVETKVAVAIAIGFMTLTAIGIGQGNSEVKTDGPNGYRPRNNPELNTHVSRQEYNSSLRPPLWLDAIQL
jgi:hypothetical protein